MVYRTWRGNQQLQRQKRIAADLTNQRFSYFQWRGIWTLSEMQTITDALTDFQGFTEYGEVSKNYGSKEISAPDLTAITLSVLWILTQTREIILGSVRVGKVASRSGFGLVGSGWLLWINAVS